MKRNKEIMEVIKMSDKNISKTENNAGGGYLAAIKDLEHKVESMFHNMWSNPFHHEKLPDTFSFSSLNRMPSLDVVDRDKEIFVKAELPGFDKDELDISIANNRLVIKAKSCKEEKEEEGDYLKQEIRKSEVYRSVSLPAEVEDENIKTSFKNGVLELTIPKQEKSQRKQIKVE
jgi:HSP20 family protein